MQFSVPTTIITKIESDVKRVNFFAFFSHLRQMSASKQGPRPSRFAADDASAGSLLKDYSPFHGLLQQMTFQQRLL